MIGKNKVVRVSIFLSVNVLRDEGKGAEKDIKGNVNGKGSNIYADMMTRYNTLFKSVVEVCVCLALPSDNLQAQVKLDSA